MNAPANLPIGDEPEDMLGGSDDPLEGVEVNTPPVSTPPPTPPTPKPAEKPIGSINTDTTAGGAKVLDGRVVDAPSALDAGKIVQKPKQTSPLLETSTVPTDALAPGTPASEPAPLQESFVMRHKFLVGLVLFLLLAGLILGGLSLFLKDSNQEEDRVAERLQPVDDPEEDIEEPIEEDIIDEEEDVEEDIEEPIEDEEEETPEEAVEDLITDPDGDGLSTTKELLAGTDPNRSDTDDDGLTDKEEMNIWKTDPLDVDTDDDTFSDGEEVRHGFNPLGEGRLFDVPKQ